MVLDEDLANEAMIDDKLDCGAVDPLIALRGIVTRGEMIVTAAIMIWLR